MNTFLVRLASAGALACFASLASAQVTLFDTGLNLPCTFNGTGNTNLGWTSGNASATQPQRWCAQPFTLPAGNWHITEITAQYFVPAGLPTDIGFKIWSRVGDVAPAVADELVTGSNLFTVASAPLAVDFVLPGGDYYLTIYAIGAVTNTIGWFTNAPNGIHFIDAVTLVPYMHRGTTYPPPSWTNYQLPAATLAPYNGSDPNKLYCASFVIKGEEAPVIYCTAGTSQTPNFCVPTIGSIGYPHVSQPAGFTIQVTNMPSQRSGIMFYSILGQTAVQWGSGSSFFCMVTPVQRMSLLTSSGSSMCDGVMGEDWLLYLTLNPLATGNPFAAGTTVQAQGWYRDPGASKNTNLSDAIEWITLP